MLALHAEAGDTAPPATIELDPDPTVATYQACALAGLGPVDAQRLLAAPTGTARVELLTRLLTEAAEVLELRLRG